MIFLHLWEAIPVKQPGILACTGAGGKTSLVQTLARQGQACHFPVILSTTTKMYYHQVERYAPILAASYEDGAKQIARRLQSGEIGAWFVSRAGEKCTGLPPGWLDKLAGDNPSCTLLVEADGARGRLIKAPAEYEPIVPAATDITVGILNLQALEQPLNEAVAHRPERVSLLLNKPLGTRLEPVDLVALAVHRQGIFQNSQGRKVLLLAGAEAVNCNLTKAVLQELHRWPSDICRCIIASGYDENMQPVEVYDV